MPSFYKAREGIQVLGPESSAGGRRVFLPGTMEHMQELSVQGEKKRGPGATDLERITGICEHLYEWVLPGGSAKGGDRGFA